MNSKASAVAVLVAVFFAGVLSTLGVQRFTESDRDGPRYRTEANHDQRDRHRRGGDRALDHLSHELDLSEEQRETVGAIMKRRWEITSELMREIEPRLRQQMDSVNAEIEEVLSEDQAARFREIMDKERRRYRRD